MKETSSFCRISKGNHRTIKQDEKSDLQFVEMALKNADDFVFLMKRYEKPLFFYIKRLIKASDAEAEDILQEVFIKIYENLNGFDKDLKFSSWIYRIAYNHTISYFRKHRKTLETLSLEDNIELFEKLRSDCNVKNEIEKEINRTLLVKALSELDKKYRDVIILKYLEDKDYQEISNILQKPMGTIATLLNRAKLKFKQVLISNNVIFN